MRRVIRKRDATEPVPVIPMNLKSCRYRILATAGALLAWLALICSPIGHYVSIATILVLIVIFFIIGLINVHRPPDE
jgi:hypothetical protein